MPDWTKSMQQTFEFYKVDPGTWGDTERLRNIEACTITRDAEVDTLGSATIDVAESLEECYVRVYLVTVQNGVTERHPLGTVLMQTPMSDFDGKVRKMSIDAYTPLLELKESMPPIGYSLLKGEDILRAAYLRTREHVRAPVVEPIVSPQTSQTALGDDKLTIDFVAEPEETWLKFIQALLVNAKHSFALDELGRVLFAPDQDTASMQPVWTYDDDNSSILFPEVSVTHDLYDVPNVVEVVYSNEGQNLFARVVNDDPNSPTSTVKRGREILYRDTSPGIDGIPSQAAVEEYARQMLRTLSSVEYTISYKHGYCGTRLGDCVRLNYKRAGLSNVKAKIISQSIKCTPGCTVTEKAVFTAKLWG